MIKITADELVKLSKEKLKGKVIVFPTDTVYGIGAMASDEEAIKKIYNLKHRNSDKPLAFLAAQKEDLLPFVEITYPETNKLMEYWPGALTLVFQKKAQTVVNHKFSTIGFRIPNSLVACKILNYLGIMVVTSMNLSGEEPLNDLGSIEKYFGNEIDYLVIDQEKFSKVSSTVLDISTNEMKILRKGSLFTKINV